MFLLLWFGAPRMYFVLESHSATDRAFRSNLSQLFLQMKMDFIGKGFPLQSLAQGKVDDRKKSLNQLKDGFCLLVLEFIIVWEMVPVLGCFFSFRKICI